LPLDMRMRMIDVPPHQPLRRRGNAPPQPFPLPPPPPFPPPPVASAIASGSALGSSSVAPPILGSGSIPPLPFPLPPPLPTPPPRQTLNSAQLRALYVPLPNSTRGRPPVSFIYICILIFY
jgi:hypothetical protein